MKALGEMSCWEVKVGWGGEEDQSCTSDLQAAGVFLL